MKNRQSNGTRLVSNLCLLVFGLVSAVAAHAASVTVNVVDNDGTAVSGFRWLLQQDTTFAVDPDVVSATDADMLDPDDLLSMNFHASYHPLALDANGDPLQGNADGSNVTISNLPDTGHYYLSVLPYSGHGISGQPIHAAALPAGGVTVVVQKNPLPTATISIFLFHDNYPTNGAPDLPEEAADSDAALLPDGSKVDWTKFSILLEEPAGRYGIAGGQVIADAFGNPLGTQYDRTCDANGANPGIGSYGCLDADGAPTITVAGDGTIHPDANGYVIIRNLAPGKYGIVAIPPTKKAGEEFGWVQTSTLEGTPVIDAWVKANEPAFFVEFGPPGPHVFIGFIKGSVDNGMPGLGGVAADADVTGQITDMHLSRAPNTQLYSGRPLPGCWVVVNENQGGLLGPALWAGPCDGPGTDPAVESDFLIPDVPAGTYQLKIFDSNLDAVIATQGLTVEADGSCLGAVAGTCEFGEIPVFNWFARLDTLIFSDDNQNGFQDPGEVGIGPESQDVSIRWRDGTIYSNFPTDGDGFAPFDEVFPFFHWLVAEVSFANKKATGATYVIDAGGFVDNTNDAFPGMGSLNPQPQYCTQSQFDAGECGGVAVGAALINPNTGDNLSRTETGQVLTNAFQAFLGQTNVMQFGKTDYLTFTPAKFVAGQPPVLPQFVGENGGISGIVYNTVTRAENEPQFAAAEEWEAGVPRVQVALYADGDIDSFPVGDWPNGYGDIDWNQNGVRDLDDNDIDDLNNDGVVTLADVDNQPLGWADGGTKGPEDIDRNGNNVFDLGDALQVSWTDSWDDSLPTGCQGNNNPAGAEVVPAISNDRCFDGLRNFNQVRPGVFDGGFAFADYDLVHLAATNADAATAITDFFAHAETIVADIVSQNAADNLQLGILPGDYIVEAAAPKGYRHIKEQDRNVDFGDAYIPSPQALAAACVGDDFVVPPYFSMTTRDGLGHDLIPGINPADAEAPYAGVTRPMCDRKRVPLSGGQNAGAEFFLMTDVPQAANISGGVLNDLANEFNPNSPSFSEKYAPPLMPIAFYDFNGKQVNRVYSDIYGRYNALVPSTYSANLPQPSGMSPNVLMTCMNDASQVPNPEFDPALCVIDPDDPTGPPVCEIPPTILDPYYDPQYSQFCYTFQFMPAATTYLDTPVVPVSAFTTPGANPLDCERPTDTPMISTVQKRGSGGAIGPFVAQGGNASWRRIIIRSAGRVKVPNPEWDTVRAKRSTVRRDYRFTPDATAELIAADGSRTALTITGQNRNRILAEVPTSVLPGDYQVVVTNDAGLGNESPMGITLTVGIQNAACAAVGSEAIFGNRCGVRPGADASDGYQAAELFAVRNVAGPAAYPNTPIQDVIDIASPGDLILVPPGSYDELVTVWKPVRLQGWGAGEVVLNARQVPTNKVLDWRSKLTGLVNSFEIDLLPGQAVPVATNFPALDEAVFPTEEGAAVFVAGKATGPNSFAAHPGARIDGFSMLGASSGGGIVVNGYAENLQIGNNRITGNSGTFGGGIRLGHPELSHIVADIDDPSYDPTANGGDGNIGALVYDDADVRNVRIHHNHIVKNGAFGGVGAGVSLHTGADNYEVSENMICGNFTQGDGAGIGHLGLSDGGVIADNFIIFNESFSQAGPQSGGGIFIGGQPALAANGALLSLSPGAGNVTIDSNIIRGNLAGAGDGGGVRIAAVNGEDIDANLDDSSQWYRVDLFNNMITNNVAGLAGGGISISDSLRVAIQNNTVANNDSVATTAEAFVPGAPNLTVAQPAGIVSRSHSGDLATLMGSVTDLSVPLSWATFSDAAISDSIVLHNRSFYWANFDDPATPILETGLVPATCATPSNPTTDPTCDVGSVAVNDYSDDLAVLGGLGGEFLSPVYSMLTDTTGYDVTNSTSTCDVGSPNCDFVNGYFNGGRDNLNIPEFTTLQTAAALDEAGNFIQVTFGPLSLIQLDATRNNPEGPLLDFHLSVGSGAINDGNTISLLTVDFDDEQRLQGSALDIGADEVQ